MRFALINPATTTLRASQLPADWRDQSAKVTNVGRVEVGSCEPDEHHKPIIDALAETGFPAYWLPEHSLLVTHTHGLLLVHQKLGLKGRFATISAGEDPTKPNCFCRLLPGGGLKVYRYGQGTKEADSWEQDGQGWTQTVYNEFPSVNSACRMAGATRSIKGWQVNAEQARQLAALYNVAAGTLYEDRPMKVIVRNGEIFLEAKSAAKEPLLDGWAEEGRRAVRLLRGLDRPPHKAIYVVGPTPGGMREVGWFITRRNGCEQVGKKEHAHRHLRNRGLGDDEAEREISRLEEQPYVQTNEPFAPLFLPGWRYNPFGARAVDPIPGPHPTYDRILTHVGQDLDAAVKAFVFPGGQRFADYRIMDGAAYLRAWLARMFRFPKLKLPFLAFHGTPDSGKSSFADAARLLFVDNRGVASGSSALGERFNGALEGAVFVICEEEDLSGQAASSRLKRFVTEEFLDIRRMQTDTYLSLNTTHWVQLVNSPSFIPVFDADARVVVIEVPSIPVSDQIPRPMLLSRLRDESPCFMQTLTGLELPPEFGKTGLPPLLTESKAQLMADNSPVETFHKLRIRPAAGKWVPKHVVFSAFCDMVGPDLLSSAKFFKVFNQVTGAKHSRGERHKDASGRLVDCYSGMELSA